MKYIITEDQFKRLKKKPIELPFEAFGNDWDTLQKFLEGRGNPRYSITDNLDLYGVSVRSLGNLISVAGNLDLYGNPIESLGSLTSVGGDLVLCGSNIESLGNLSSVGGDLDLHRTPLSKILTGKQIQDTIKVGGQIYL